VVAPKGGLGRRRGGCCGQGAQGKGPGAPWRVYRRAPTSSLVALPGCAARCCSRAAAPCFLSCLSRSFRRRRARTVLSPPQEEGQTKLSVSSKVDPSLVSGITVEIGDKFLDYSVATQLKKLQQLLKDGV
jgi:hypothetical protein